MIRYVGLTVKNPMITLVDYIPTYNGELHEGVYDVAERMLADAAKDFEPERNWRLTKEEYENKLVDFYNMWFDYSIEFFDLDEDENDWLIAYDV